MSPTRFFLSACALAVALASGACSSSRTPTIRFEGLLGNLSPSQWAPAPTVAQRRGVRKIGNPYTIGGRVYVPRHDPSYDRTGIASWYGADFHGKATANGEIYDMNQLTAAHPTLELPSYVRVTNLENGRSLVLRVNDRGPFVGDRIIDLSRAAAIRLGSYQSGLAHVRVQYIGPAPL